MRGKLIVALAMVILCFALSDIRAETAISGGRAQNIEFAGVGDIEDNSFYGVSNHLTADQRIFHAFSAHGDTIRYGDGIENNGLTPGLIGAALGFLGEQVNVHVAGGNITPGRGHADDGLGKIARFEAGRIEHGPARGTIGAIKHDG